MHAVKLGLFASPAQETWQFRSSGLMPWRPLSSLGECDYEEVAIPRVSWTTRPAEDVGTAVNLFVSFFSPVYEEKNEYRCGK